VPPQNNRISLPKSPAIISIFITVTVIGVMFLFIVGFRAFLEGAKSLHAVTWCIIDHPQESLIGAYSILTSFLCYWVAFSILFTIKKPLNSKNLLISTSTYFGILGFLFLIIMLESFPNYKISLSMIPGLIIAIYVSVLSFIRAEL
jgi:hypothetical protein